MGYRPGAADPPFMGGGREGSETWSRCNIYYMLCMICVHIYVTICLGPLIYGCVEQMHGCVEQMHIISNYIYIYMLTMMGMDGLDGYWMENMLV